MRNPAPVSRPFARRLRRGPAAFAVAILCVGLGATASPAPAAETKNATQAFFRAGDDICKASNDKLGELALDYERHVMLERKTARSKRQKIAKPADVAAFITTVGLAELTRQVDALENLEPPASLKTEFSAAIREARAALKEIEKNPKKSAYKNPYDKAAKMFRTMGFSTCGHNLAASKGVS